MPSAMTCMVSNLPINPGDEIVSFFIVKNKFIVNNENVAGVRTDPYDFFNFLSLPIHSEYDDCQFIECDTSDSNNMDITYKHMEIICNVIKNEIHVPTGQPTPSDRNNFTPNMLMNGVLCEKLYLDSYRTLNTKQSDVLGIGIAMVHKSIYDTMINYVHKDYSGVYTLERATIELDEIIKQCKGAGARFDKLNHEQQSLMISKSELNKLIKERHKIVGILAGTDYPVDNIYGDGMNSDNSFMYIKRYFKYLINSVDDNKQNDVEILKPAFIEFFMFQYGFRTLRRLLLPSCISGEQYGLSDLHEQVIREQLKHVLRDKIKWSEENYT